MIASSHPPRRIGFRVTSYVMHPKSLSRTPYCAAARIMPGITPFPRSAHQRQPILLSVELTLSAHLPAVDIGAHDVRPELGTSIQKRAGTGEGVVYDFAWSGLQSAPAVPTVS